MTLPIIRSFRSSTTTESARLVHRVRSPRTAEPEANVPLGDTASCAYDPKLAAFLDRLLELSVVDWIRIGRSLIADRDALLVRQRAWALLEAAIADHRLGVAAWEIRDAIDTAACLATRGARGWSRDTRGCFASTHGAAEAAALALLARGHLRADAVAALTTPFAALIA